MTRGILGRECLWAEAGWEARWRDGGRREVEEDAAVVMEMVRRGWLSSRVLGVVLIAWRLSNRSRELNVFVSAIFGVLVALSLLSGC